MVTICLCIAILVFVFVAKPRWELIKDKLQGRRYRWAKIGENVFAGLIILLVCMSTVAEYAIQQNEELKAQLEQHYICERSCRNIQDTYNSQYR